MAASHNLPQLPCSIKSPISKGGVLTIQGFGVRVRMQSGHLEIEDGLGPERHTIRLARVNHNLRRLVCISDDGFVTLSALKWLSDISASFVMLDRTGKVLFVTGPTASSDSRVRQAQSLALGNGSALVISKELISAKLRGQENLVRDKLKNSAMADVIAGFGTRLTDAENLDAVRLLEAHAAVAYWNAWRDVSILWPKCDVRRVPAHWRTFGTRASPLTGGPRLAVNPPNAILNYCFALLESETRLALVALGLDPGIGFLHPARAYRDSLALDVMEAVRPEIERWLYQWVMTEPLRRADFHELGTGNCRLMSGLCSQLSETAPTWGKLIAPWAEFVAQTLSSGIRAKPVIATRLTQRNKREVKNAVIPTVTYPRPEHVCGNCGAKIARGKRTCRQCWKRETVKEFEIGRKSAQHPDAIAKRADTMLQHRKEIRNWKPSDLPAWLTREFYVRQILPALARVAKSRIRSELHISEPYASYIQDGTRIPHPRHWKALAEIAGISHRQSFSPHQAVVMNALDNAGTLVKYSAHQFLRGELNRVWG
jgi:CRISPR-associated endonuclease Cas1